MLALLVALVVAGSVQLARAVSSEEVDTALIVAIDVSNSVDEKRYKLQMEGIAQALEDPGVIQAIVGGAKGGILFSLVTWADQPTVNLPWTHIASEADAKAGGQEGARAAASGRRVHLHVAHDARRLRQDRAADPSKAAKVVLDVSGDGKDNCNSQEPIEQVRDELVKYGVTVNGLPILENAGPEIVTPGAPSSQSYLPGKQQVDPLEQWYTDNVKGGPGSFVLPANGYSDFGRAIRQKFVLEVSDAGSRAAPRLRRDAP